VAAAAAAAAAGANGLWRLAGRHAVAAWLRQVSDERVDKHGMAAVAS